MYERAARASLKRQREAAQPPPYISQPMLTLSRELAGPLRLLHVQQCSALMQAELC